MIMSSFKYGFSIIEALKSQGSNDALDTNSLYIADYDMPELNIFSTFHKAKQYLQENYTPSLTNQFRFVMPAGKINAAKAGSEIESETGKIIIPKWTRIECNDATYIEAVISSEATMQDVITFGLDAIFMCYVSAGQIESIEGDGAFIAFYNSVIRKIQMTNGGIYLSECILNLSDTTTYLNDLYFIAFQDVAMLNNYPSISINENTNFNIKGSNTHAYITSVANSNITIDNSQLTFVPIDVNPIEINCDITLESSKLSIDGNSELYGAINGKNGFVMNGGNMDVYGEILNDISISAGNVDIKPGASVSLTEQDVNVIVSKGGTSEFNSPLKRKFKISIKAGNPILSNGLIDLASEFDAGKPTRIKEVDVYNQTQKVFMSIISITGIVIQIDATVLSVGDELIVWFK